LTPFPVNYGYDDLGELTSATGYEPSGTARANENFGYGYDLAGNLLLRTNNTLIQEFTLDNANEVVNIQRLRGQTITFHGAFRIVHLSWRTSRIRTI